MAIRNLAQFIRRQNDLGEFTRGRIYSLHVDAKWGYKRISKILHLSVNSVATYCKRAVDPASRKGKC